MSWLNGLTCSWDDRPVILIRRRTWGEREGGRECVCVCVGGGGGRDKGEGLKLGTMRAGIVNVPPPPSTYLCLAYIGNLRPSITLLNN